VKVRKREREVWYLGYISYIEHVMAFGWYCFQIDGQLIKNTKKRRNDARA